MTEPHIRKVRPEEIEEVWRVHVASSNDGIVRRGRMPARSADTPVASDARAGLASDPDGYFCAVEEGQIRGMVSALVRGSCLASRASGCWHCRELPPSPGPCSRSRPASRRRA